eukprot:EG_transcript_7498
MDYDSDQEKDDAQAQALHLEGLYKKGKLIRNLASHLDVNEVECHRVKVRGRCLTCLAVTQDDAAVFLGDVSGDVYRYDMGAEKLTTLRCRPRSPIYDISCNFANSMFATAHQDGMITLWDSRSCQVIDRLGKMYGHRGPVYSVCFQKGKESILLSASKDRTVKMWACDDRVYMRTLYGHRSAVLRVHALQTERAVSISDDRQPRMWKTEADTVLAYKMQDAVLEDVAMASEFHFLTTSTNGAVTLYHRDKQKPLAVRPAAHGHHHVAPTSADGPEFAPSFGSALEKALALDPKYAAGGKPTAAEEEEEEDDDDETPKENGTLRDDVEEEEEEDDDAEEVAQRGKDGHKKAEAAAPGAAPKAGKGRRPAPAGPQANWVPSIAAVHNADLFATGSCDGVVRLWEAALTADDPAIRPLGSLPLAGWVNGLAFTQSADRLVACSGPHHRLGRWLAASGKGAHNQLVIARLRYDTDVTDLSRLVDRVGEIPLPPARTKREPEKKKAQPGADDAEDWRKRFGWKETKPRPAREPALLPRAPRGAARAGKREHGSYLPPKVKRTKRDMG